MDPDFIDIGVNLTHESFARDREAVLERARRARVLRLIITGADAASSAQAAALAADHPGELWSTAGVHPHHALQFSSESQAQLLTLLSCSAVVAVGECGLDYFRDFSPRAAQRNAFAAQLEIAVATRKPIFLHQRDAHEDFSAILADFSNRLSGAVAHCFTGGRRELERYLELGLSIGVTGWVCDERRGQDLQAAVPYIPSERLMLETDAPYLLPRDLAASVKSRRNEPCFLPHVAAAVARLRNQSVTELAAQTTSNAAAFFHL